jgi:NAD+ kinase
MRIQAIFNETDDRQKSYIKFLTRTFPEVIAEENPEMYFVIGGDGAMLHAHNKFSDADIPFFGKGFGTLNFIMNNYDDNFEVLDGLLTGEIIPDIIKTLKLRVRVEKKNGDVVEKLCINDIVIGNNIMDWHKFKINSAEKSFNEMNLRGTGLCISTPLGSTAYNINNGGNALPLDANLTSITGIACDYRVNEIMTPQDISIEITSYRHQPFIYIDGVVNSIPLEMGDVVRIGKSENVFSLAFLNKEDFFSKRMELVQKKR